MSKPNFPIRGFGRGIVRRADSADLPKNSLHDGRNLRLDLTGDPVARPGTAVIAVPNMPNPARGPWEYADPAGYTALIVADSTGGIYEIKNGATKIGQFPATAAQTVRSIENCEFGRLVFTNEIDRPHILHRPAGAWEFRPSGISETPGTPTAEAETTDEFTNPNVPRYRMAYKTGSGASFLLGSHTTNQFRKRFSGAAWENTANPLNIGLNAYDFGGPFCWFNSPDLGEPSGMLFAGGIQHLPDPNPTPAITDPPHYSRALSIYDWQSNGYPDPFYKKLKVTESRPMINPTYYDYALWHPASCVVQPRTWGTSRLFAYLMRDWYCYYSYKQGNTWYYQNNCGIAFCELTNIDSQTSVAEFNALHTQNVSMMTSTTNAVQPDSPTFNFCYYSLYTALMTAAEDGQIFVLEQPGVESGGDVVPVGNAQLIRYDISGANATRANPVACPFQITSRMSGFIYRHGSADGKLHYYEHGSTRSFIYNSSLGTWSPGVAAANARYGPFDTSAPETGYVWYFNSLADGEELVRELIPGATPPSGMGVFKFGVTFIDNAGAESAVSEVASLSTQLNATARVKTISIGGPSITKRRIWSSLSDADQLYFLAEIANNTDTEVSVSTDNNARYTKRLAPDADTRGLAPAGVSLAAAWNGEMIYTLGAEYLWSEVDAPDNFPPTNRAFLGADRRAIKQIGNAGEFFVMRKDTETYVFGDIADTPTLRLPTLGILHPESVLQHEQLGEVCITADGVYAFDGYNARMPKLSDELDDEFLHDLMTASRVSSFKWRGRLFWLAGSKAYIYEPSPGRWLPCDEFPFTTTDCRYIRNRYNLAGGALSIEGIWAIGGGKLYRLENETTFDLAAWSGTALDFETPDSIPIRYMVETQELLFADAREVNAYSLHVDAEVTP